MCSSTSLASALPGAYSVVLLWHARARLVSAGSAPKSSTRVYGSGGHAPRLLGCCRLLRWPLLASLQLLLCPLHKLGRLVPHLLELGRGEFCGRTSANLSCLWIYRMPGVKGQGGATHLG